MPRRPTDAAGTAHLPVSRPGLTTQRKGLPRQRRASPQLGRLVLVVGPSGAGKDTLIAAAKRKFRDDPAVAFPRRVINRPEGIGEDHAPVSRREFARLEQDGAFILSWQAHGLRYGLPSEILKDLDDGRIVVVNVSRAIVAAACARWPDTHIVEVKVALDALKARLEARGRETADDIKRRLARASRKKKLPSEAIDVIDNSGHLPTAVRKFNALIAGYAASLAAAKGKR